MMTNKLKNSQSIYQYVFLTLFEELDEINTLDAYFSNL